MSIITSLQESLGVSSPSPSQAPKKPLNDITNNGGSQKTLGNIAATNVPNALQMGNIYSPAASNWYAAKPYGFKMNRRDGSEFIMFLPISPSNINIVTNFATNVIPTLYGTVEEHSDVRYFDITIEGTTGIVPKFVTPTATGDEFSAYNSSQQKGRALYPIQSNVALGGFFSSTIGQVTNILNQVNKAVSTISGLLSGGSTAAPQPETGVYTDQTGYLAFHNLYRFLLKYKKDAAGVENGGKARTTHPLTFFNYKDGNQYDVAVKNFVLRRSAENPMMYFYSITMRGYNIRSAGVKLQATEDLNQRLSDLGLNGVKSSLLSSIKSVSDSAKAIVGSVVSGANLLGR